MKLPLLALGLMALGTAACTNSTADEETRPEWVTGAWTSGESTLFLQHDGTYVTMNSDLWDGGGTWGVSGSNLIVRPSSSRSSMSIQLQPVVGCSLVKMDRYWMARPNNPAADCPNPEPALTDSEQCVAGSYSRHVDRSVRSNDWTHGDYIDTDDFTVTLASEHFYEMTAKHFDTNGYVSHRGYGFVMGRWELDDAGRVHLVPLVYDNLAEAPTEQSVVVSTQGAKRTFDGATYDFVGGCK